MINSIFDFLIANSIKFMIILGMGLVFFTTKNHFPKKIRKYMTITFILIFIYSIVASIDKYIGLLEVGTVAFPIVMVRRISAFLGYSLRPIIIVYSTFIIFDMSNRKRVLFSIPAILNSIIHFTGIWTCLAFTIDKDNIFQRGPLGYTSFVVAGLYVLFLLYLSINTIVSGRKKEGTILVFIVVCCIISALADILSKSTSNYLGNALCVSLMFYYLFLNIEYTEEYEDELLRSKENELILSQVRPHFMYNVLTTIYYLCDHDTKKAKKAVNDFSLYLRHNLDTMRSEQIVDFNNEISYVEYYLALEKIRFEDELNFEFDLQTKNFRIPKFTLQPIVENAVKHGISQKEGGGLIKIYTIDEPTRIKVGVVDNGVGFDINKKPDDGRSHVGVTNISYRLLEFLNEELHIESKVGEGTHVYFYVPKNIKI